MPTWSSPSRITPVGVTERAIGCSRAAGAAGWWHIIGSRISWKRPSSASRCAARASGRAGTTTATKPALRSSRNTSTRGYDLDFLLDSGFAPRRHALEWLQAEKLADAHGYRLIGMIHGTREGDDLMVVRCRACGRQSVERPGDVEFGCTCKGKGLGDRNPYPADHALPAKAQSNS